MFSVFIICFLLCYILIKLNMGFMEDPKVGYQKFHRWHALRAGGVAIYMSILVYLSALYIMGKIVDSKPLFTGLVSMPAFLAGLFEDVTKQVHPRQRLLLAFISGILAGILMDAHLVRVDVPVVDWLISNFFVSLFFTAFALAGVSNAINIIDGFNGLASGVGIIVFLSYAYIAHQLGDEFLLNFSLIYISALLGFFLWNFPWGKIFLGDGGAYLTGFLAGLVGVLMVNRHAEVSAWFPFTLLFYPIWETWFSMFRRWFIHKKTPTDADTLHLHSLIYKRVTRHTFSSPRLANSLTSPYLWLMELICAVPAILFWNSTPLLVLTCVGFAFFYTWLYFRIVRFKTPAFLRKLCL